MNKPVLKLFHHTISLHTPLYMLYFFLAPMEDILNNSAGTVVKYLAIIIFVVTLIENHGEINAKDNIANRCIIWLLLITVASLLWSIDRQITLNRMTTYLLVPGFCLYTSTLNFTKKEFDLIVLSAILGGIIGAGAAFFSGAVLDEQMADRMILTENNDPNNFAALLLLPFAVTWWRVQDNTQKLKRILYAVALAIIVFTLLMTGSRGGFFSLLVILVSYYFVSGMYKRASAILGTAILLAIMFFLLRSYLPTDLFNRLFTLTNYTTTGAGRTTVWQILFRDIIPEMGVFGLGPGCVSIKLTSYYGFAKGVHNTYLNMLCEYGILGLPAFVLMIVSIVRRNYKRKFYIGVALLIGICTTIFFLDAYAKKFFWNVIMLLFIHEGIEEDHNMLVPYSG